MMLQDDMCCSLKLQNESNGINTATGSWHGMVEVYDLGGLSFSQLHVPGIRMLSRVLAIGQAHYPENLRKGFIINAPMIISGVWAMISPVLHANTRAKLQILRTDGREELLAILGSEETLARLRSAVPR